MLLEALIDRTLTRFPHYERAGIKMLPLEKGGSDRDYYRVEAGGADSLILVKYGDQREENRHYVSIARFLRGQGIKVPRIYFHDEEEGLIWMEDLGGVDLWEHRAEPWLQLGPLYRRALDQAVLLHTRVRRSQEVEALRLEREFNAELYLWEQNYFFENCLERYFKIDAAIIDLHRHSAPLEQIAAELAALPRVLVHRDFQSQNIMVREGETFLIDFQGLRPGLAQYDLASLLYDPYVALTAAQREELFEYYVGKSSFGAGVSPGFRRAFDLCAMQRLMQALGAYGYLGLVKERLQFLDYIPPAIASLREVVSRISGLHNLGLLLDNLPSNCSPAHGKAAPQT